MLVCNFVPLLEEEYRIAAITPSGCWGGNNTTTPAHRFLQNVPSIVPLLEKEYRIAAKRLEDTQEELNDLHPDKCALLRGPAACGSVGDMSHDLGV